MKTTLLFVLAIMIGFAAFAQKQANTRQMVQKPAINHLNLNIPGEATVQPGTTNKPAPRLKSANMVELVPMGSSINIFSILTTGQRFMAYDPTTNTLMHAHRGDNVTPGFGTGNDVIAAYSDDMGANFGEKTAFTGSSAQRCRYPSGVLSNPAGNTTINNLYSVVAGPVTNGSGWIDTFYGSRTYDGTNVNQVYEPTTSNGELIRNGMFSTDNGMVGIGETQQLNDGNGYTDLYGFTTIGTFNTSTNAFDYDFGTWDPQEYIYFDATNGWYRSWSASYQMCFSRDGSIGYRWTDGVDNRAVGESSFYPIVYKTTDGGATWNILDYFDFGSPQDVYDHMIDVASGGRVAPWFQGSDGVVDYQGNLHLFAYAISAVSTNVDSLTWLWTNDFGSVFEFEYNNANNSWNGIWCDTLRTDDVSTTNTIYGTGSNNVGWDKRIHASISPDGKKVFAIWTDTDDYAFWNLGEPLNMYPDLKVWGRDLETNLHTLPANRTYEGGAGAAWGACYFTASAPICIDADGYYEIPTSLADIATNNFDPDKPVFHYYMKGIEVADNEFAYGPVPVIALSQAPDFHNVLTSSYVTGNQWYRDGAMIAGATGQTYDVDVNGDYYVICTNYGVVTPESNHITILDVNAKELPKVQSMEVYPNPNNGKFNLSVSSNVSTKVDLKVVSSVGVTVYERNNMEINGTFNELIDLHNLAKGVYSVVVSDQGKQVVRKLVVK